MCQCECPARCRTPIIASSTSSSSSFSPLTHPYPAARTAPHRHREPLLLVSHHGLNELAHTPRAVCDAKRGGVPSSSLILLARSSRCIPHRHPPISIPPTSAVQSNARRTLRAKAAAASQSDVAERRQGPRGRTPCLLHVVSVRSNPERDACFLLPPSLLLPPMAPPPPAASSSSSATFEFVVGNRPDQLKGLATSRLRSHVSKRGWQAHLAVHRPPPPPPTAALSNGSSSSSSSPTVVDRKAEADAAARERRRRRRRRGGKPVSVTYELATAAAPPPPYGDDDEVDDWVDRGQDAAAASLIQLPRGRSTAASALLVDPLLGGTRVDPFRAYPGPWHPNIPAWTDNCK